MMHFRRARVEYYCILFKLSKTLRTKDATATLFALSCLKMISFEKHGHFGSINRQNGWKKAFFLRKYGISFCEDSANFSAVLRIRSLRMRFEGPKFFCEVIDSLSNDPVIRITDKLSHSNKFSNFTLNRPWKSVWKHLYIGKNSIISLSFLSDKIICFRSFEESPLKSTKCFLQYFEFRYWRTKIIWLIC